MVGGKHNWPIWIYYLKDDFQHLKPHYVRSKQIKRNGSYNVKKKNHCTLSVQLLSYTKDKIVHKSRGDGTESSLKLLLSIIITIKNNVFSPPLQITMLTRIEKHCQIQCIVQHNQIILDATIIQKVIVLPNIV